MGKHYRFRNLVMTARKGGIAVADTDKGEDLDTVRLIPVPIMVARRDDLADTIRYLYSQKGAYYRSMYQEMLKGVETVDKVIKDAVKQGDPTDRNVLQSLSNERKSKPATGVGQGLWLPEKG